MAAKFKCVHMSEQSETGSFLVVQACPCRSCTEGINANDMMCTLSSEHLSKGILQLVKVFYYKLK